MRDLVSCFSETAINVASLPSHHHNTHYSFSCSSSSSASAASSVAAAASPAPAPSVQTAVSSLYRVHLPSHKKPILLSVTWAHHGLTISFGGAASSFKLNTSSALFRRKKGSKSVESPDSKVEIYWDLSAARYDSGRPEPADEFYVVVVVDSEIALVLGDEDSASSVCRKFLKSAGAKVSLISRQEHCSGSTLYCTRARFSESGAQHDVLIKCSGGSAAGRHPVLSVSIDKKVVIRVKRLQWNFRGNQTIFVDGLLVDLMWDVHDWFFNPTAAAAAAAAVFMFRTRSGLDSRLWLEEKLAHKEDQLQHQHQKTADFSLLIYACKSP